MSQMSEKWFGEVLRSLYPSTPKVPHSERYEELKQKCLALEKNNPLGMSIIFMIDYSKMKYHYISDFYCQFTGADPRKVQEETIEYALSFMHPAYLESFTKEVYQDMFSFVKSLNLNGEDRSHIRASYNYKIRNKNGEYYSFVQRTIPLEFDEQGHPLMDMGIVTLDNSYTDDQGILLYIDKLDTFNIYQNIYRKHFPVLTKPNSTPLTSREMEIVMLIKNGLSSREIAERLFLSEHTVKNHKRNIFEKAGVNKVTELLDWLHQKE